MKYTLVADGSSDRVLLPILTWSLKRHRVSAVSPQWADFSRIPRPSGLAGRIRAALDLYPCDILFIHRDAEAQPPEERRDEIARAWTGSDLPYVPVVPVRMTEAWLLADERAIRSAAGNPLGSQQFNLPALGQLESLPDPKQVLLEALAQASGLSPTRRARFRARERVHSIPNYIDDYSPLLCLTAFQALQDGIASAIGPPA